MSNVYRLGDVFTLIGGGTPSTQIEEYWGEGTPWISSADITESGTITYRRKVTNQGIQSSTTNILPMGTVVVVTRVGLGKVALLPEDMCFSQDIQGLLPKNDLIKYSPAFLRYQLSYIMQYVKYQGQGTTISGITKKRLCDIQLFIPNLEVQERIVARIEELFSELDNGVETLRKTKQQLAVYRQAVLSKAFAGNYPEVQLNVIARAIGGYAFKSKKYTPDGKYTVVKIGNVKPFRFDFSRDHSKTNECEGSILEKYLLQKGDCLITLTGSRGKRDYGFVSLIRNQENYLLNQRVAALRFDQRVAVPEFYQYYLSSRTYRNQFFSYETGNVGQGNVGMKALTEPLVICPPIQKQWEIVSEIEAQLSSCDSIEKTVDTALQQAEAMRQSILKRAFEGKL